MKASKGNAKSLLRRVLLGMGLLAVINAAVLACLPQERTRVLGWFDDWTSRSRRGFVSRVYVDEEGKQHKYVVFVPFSFDASSRPPLLLFLHGLAPSGEDGINQLQECLGPAIWEMKGAFPFVVVFPQCPAGGNWEFENKPAQLALRMLEKTAGEYGTDPDRVYLTGVSTGGSGTWSIAAREPDYFAAIVPISGVSIDASAAAALADSHLPINNFYVRGDNKETVDANRQMHRALIAEGASPHFTEFDGTLSKTWWTHNAWGNAYRNAGVYDWLLRQTKSRNRAEAKKYRVIHKGLDDSAWQQSGNGNFSIDEDGSLVAQSSAADSDSLLTFTNSRRDFDVHFEFLVDKGSRCVLHFPRSLDEQDEGAGWRLEVVAPISGGGGVFETESGACLQGADPVAQRAFREHDWNDLRIGFRGDALDVSLNGRQLLQVNDKQLSERTGSFAYLLPSSTEGRLRLRNIRFRELDDVH